MVVEGERSADDMFGAICCSFNVRHYRFFCAVNVAQQISRYNRRCDVGFSRFVWNTADIVLQSVTYMFWLNAFLVMSFDGRLVGCVSNARIPTSIAVTNVISYWQRLWGPETGCGGCRTCSDSRLSCLLRRGARFTGSKNTAVRYYRSGRLSHRAKAFRTETCIQHWRFAAQCSFTFTNVYSVFGCLHILVFEL